MEQPVQRWRIPRDNSDVFKGCKVSPDGNVIAYWSDSKISLFTPSSVSNADGDFLKTFGEHSLESLGSTSRFWKAVCVTNRYLIATTTGNIFNVSLIPELLLMLLTFDLAVLHIRPRTRGCNRLQRTELLAHSASNSSGSIHHGDVHRPTEFGLRSGEPGRREPLGVNLPCENRGSDRVRPLCLSTCVCLARIRDQLADRESRMGSISEEHGIEQSGRNLLGRFIALDWPAEDVMSLSLTSQNRCYAAIRPYLRTDDIYHMPVVSYSLTTRDIEEVFIEPRVSSPLSLASQSSGEPCH